ncbi:arogenate dehydratase/prephenate dehydratase 6, chloroplastic-like [Olea europaea var. sylvestris]|uniref:arogenate dehydratase/prephenate dehydratase 6, chloroplastic-like n=1 Tax=Olea europaea var. sylvestris TaxID=158386 RepID=UPI000C1D2395|nr:arogenate dehydratase/prephenate dehydratase 6, chloroplastic-like [Olea europaea var. sylvestris]
MQSLNPPWGSIDKSIVRIAAPPGRGLVHHRSSPSRLSVKCVDSANAGGTPHEWQSCCAILASKVTSLQQDSKNHYTGVAGVASVNDDKTLELVPVNGARAGAKSSLALPKPLSLANFSATPVHGSQLRVAYRGVPGAYSETAAGKAYPKCEAIPCDQFEIAFQAVEHYIADRAVIPVENSHGGSIHRNYDLLLRHRLPIVGEVQLPVHHCLVALPGVRIEHLTRIISHPQALSQCENTLTKLGLKAAREAFEDTAGAAEYIATNNLRDTAAIASSRAAELYGLQILANGIQDDSSNFTRFVVLSREPIIPRSDRPFKTSIAFAQEKGTNTLFKVLSSFAFRNINLMKIESRPHRYLPVKVADGGAKHFEYMFYVDFEASMAEERAQNAMAEVQEFTYFLRVLGSYPMDMTPWKPANAIEES